MKTIKFLLLSFILISSSTLLANGESTGVGNGGDMIEMAFITGKLKALEILKLPSTEEILSEHHYNFTAIDLYEDLEGSQLVFIENKQILDESGKRVVIGTDRERRAPIYIDKTLAKEKHLSFPHGVQGAIHETLHHMGLEDENEVNELSGNIVIAAMKKETSKTAQAFFEGIKPQLPNIIEEHRANQLSDNIVNEIMVQVGNLGIEVANILVDTFANIAKVLFEETAKGLAQAGIEVLSTIMLGSIDESFFYGIDWSKNSSERELQLDNYFKTRLSKLEKKCQEQKRLFSENNHEQDGLTELCLLEIQRIDDLHQLGKVIVPFKKKVAIAKKILANYIDTPNEEEDSVFSLYFNHTDQDLQTSNMSAAKASKILTVDSELGKQIYENGQLSIFIYNPQILKIADDFRGGDTLEYAVYKFYDQEDKEGNNNLGMKELMEKNRQLTKKISDLI